MSQFSVQEGHHPPWRWFGWFRRRPAPFYPVPARFGPVARRVVHYRPTARLAARVALTLLVVVHLALAAVFPGGRNPLFEADAPSVFSYQGIIPVGDALGFYKTRGRDGFIVYKIYSQDGVVIEGAFPDQKVAPRLRYDRWALLSHQIGAGEGDSHGAFVKYLVARLPAAPVKVELLSAKWDWSRGNGNAGVDSGNHGGLLVLRKLGTYDGLRKLWRPARTEGKK